MSKKCFHDSCNRTPISRGYCQAHYVQFNKNGFTKDLKVYNSRNRGDICKISGCNKDTQTMGYCRSHYMLSRNHERSIDGVQDSSCEACGVTGRRMHIDHDHSCCPQGKSCKRCYRGILCSQCNMALGLLHDNIDTIKLLAEYLDRYNNSIKI